MSSQEDRLGDGKRASIYGVPTAAEVTARREVAGGWPGVEVWIPLTHQTESVVAGFGIWGVQSARYLQPINEERVSGK